MVMTSFREWPSDGGPHTSDSIGQALSGLVVRDASGNPVPGMLAPPTVSAVAASWKVQVGRFVHVRNVSGAARFSGLSASEQVDITPAAGIPAGQARIDLVCWNPATMVLLVVSGVPGVTPVVPSAGGMVPVAQVRVNASDGMVVAAQVVSRFTNTGLASAGETRTVTVTLTGTAGWNGVASWRDFQVINFSGVFDVVPGVEATGVFPSAAVQLMQITQVTKTGFSGRVIRIGHATPLGGTVTYTATAL